MTFKWKAASVLAVMAFIAAAPAYGTVTLHFVPQNSVIPAVGGTANVEVWADFTEEIVGWGLDLDVFDPGVADLIGFTVGPLWDPALSTIDGDLLGGNIDPIANPNGIGPAAGILLATLTFQAFGLGTTPIALSTSGDEDEGFALSDLSGLDAVNFANGTITVPEPASLVLIALGGLMVLRRR